MDYQGYKLCSGNIELINQQSVAERVRRSDKRSRLLMELGLHARPAAEFVLAAKTFRSQIWLVKGEGRFSAASILEVLTANLNCGETAVIEAEGPDAAEAVKRLVALTGEFGKGDSKRPALRRLEEDF